ncbi:unnamed protein product [Effrenium voratum]|nr:unnamed protein product [Effrenium voratum]
MFQIRGYPMTQGSVWPKGDPHNKAAEQDDCNVVRLFREAGAIIVGSTAMTEFGVTPLGRYSLHTKGPFNAYNAQHYPLGSSSGSAVAVALGLVPVAVGADGGGSIRIPAAGEGVFGLACTYGRIPDDSDSSTLGTMQKCGPLAASARDAALAYALMAPQVPNFYSQLYGEFPGLPHVHLKDFLSSNLQGLRLGVFWEHFNDAEPQVVESCKKALDALRAAGAEIVEITIPHLKSLQLAHAVTISVEFAAISGHLMHNQHQLEPSTRIQFGLGVSFSGVEVQSANIMRGWALNHIRTIFKEQKISAIVSPTLGLMPPAMPPGAKDAGESDSALILQTMMKYIFLANLCGFPAMSVPVGYDEVTKIPVGFHFMSDHWDEAVLLRLAHAVEVHHLKRERPKDFAKILA